MDKQILIYIISFFIYSFAGWIWESIIIHTIWMKKFVNRGFLNGPLLPIYGSGALFVVFLLQNEAPNMAFYQVFIVGGTLACILEYVTSYVMEKLFHERWWDYSHKKYNLNGRICLEGYLAFGLFSLLTIKYIQPFFNKIIGEVPSNYLLILSTILSVGFIIDVIMSTRVALDIKKELDEVMVIIEKQQLKLHQALNDRQKELENIQSIEALRQQITEIQNKLKENKKYRYGHRRILMAYPYLIKQRIKKANDKLYKKL